MAWMPTMNDLYEAKMIIATNTNIHTNTRSDTATDKCLHFVFNFICLYVRQEQCAYPTGEREWSTRIAKWHMDIFRYYTETRQAKHTDTLKVRIKNKQRRKRRRRKKRKCINNGSQRPIINNRIELAWNWRTIKISIQFK